MTTEPIGPIDNQEIGPTEKRIRELENKVRGLESQVTKLQGAQRVMDERVINAVKDAQKRNLL